MRDCRMCKKRNNCPYIPEEVIPTNKHNDCISYKPTLFTKIIDKILGWLGDIRRKQLGDEIVKLIEEAGKQLKE